MITQNFASFVGFLEHIMYSGVFTFTHPLTMNYILFFYCSRKAIEGISTLKSKMDTLPSTYTLKNSLYTNITYILYFNG